MPELPDITVYIEALESRIVGQPLEGIRIPKPFLLRSVEPPLSTATGKRVIAVRRMGKRIVLALEDDLFIVVHLMIAGRLRWLPAGGKVPGKIGLAAFDFPNGTLILTEAGSKRRASLWLVRGESALEQFERGGLEVLDASLTQFSERLTRENHTLKRSLTDPRLFSGIGNAYSDEILHRAKISPIKHTRRLSQEEIQRLFVTTKETLLEWTDRLRREAKGDFPAKVTAFREEMAVHGKFGKPCPVCGAPVQRIR
jgi:formamidopyrimidine-DNA glycosylase